jgi:hypothetical protein
MRISTQNQPAAAIERLRRLEPKTLARFIVSLSEDPGPVGEQVRTFIVGNDVVLAAASLRERIGNLGTPSEYEHRHARGRELGARLGFILDGIETWVLPVDPKSAFGLLVGFFEADAVAMENCGDHDFDVSCAFARAAELIRAAARSLPKTDVRHVLEGLLLSDAYEVRKGLAELVHELEQR